MATCANIGPAERRRRHRLGVLAIALGTVVVIAAWTLDLALGMRAASGLLFFLGFAGIFQARARTCVVLASRGACDMDAGPETIQDGAAVAAIRAQARDVMIRSAIAALIVTGVAVLVR